VAEARITSLTNCTTTSPYGTIRRSEEVRFAPDSTLEQAGFELPPLTRRQTDGSDPPHPSHPAKFIAPVEALAAVSVPQSSNAATLRSWKGDRLTFLTPYHPGDEFGAKRKPICQDRRGSIEAVAWMSPLGSDPRRVIR
jgi:hypothetical protein